MATDHNFKVKNGLNVDGANLIIEEGGESSTRIKSTGEIRFRPEGSTSNKVRITLNTTHISGSLDASANVDANQFRINGTTVIDSSRQIYAKTGTQVGEDGQYSGYGVIGFGGITNGYNRVFGRDDTNDGLYLAAGTGNKVMVRANGSANNTFILGYDDSYSAYSSLGFGGSLQNGNNRIFAGAGTSDGMYINAATGRGIFFRVNGNGSNVFQIGSDGGLYVGTSAGTLVLDQSRNLTNIGTISSGEITVGPTSGGSGSLIRATGAFSGDAIGSPSNVPLVLQATGSDTTFLGALNQYGRQVFAVNISGSADSNTQRGVIDFYTKTNGSFQKALTLSQDDVIVRGDLTVDGAITSSGAISGTNGAFSGSLALSADSSQLQLGTGNRAQIFHNSAALYLRTSTGSVIVQASALNHYSADATTLYFSAASGGLSFGGTQFLTSSRNLTNIGTISSGAISTTGNFTLTKSGSDAVIEALANGSNDSILNLRSTQGSLTTEGFQIWYDNSVGDVHIHTTYPHDNAAMRFHTRTGTNKATNNERFTIEGNGNFDFHGGDFSNVGTISSGAITSSGTITASGGNSTNWNTAYGWGNHASAGYLTGSPTNLSVSGYLNIGTRIGTVSPGLSITGDTNSTPIIAKSGYDTMSILPWDNITYIASGTYYDDGTWVHASTYNDEALLGISGNTGGRWYATTNGVGGSWNHASNVQLWNNSGVWTSGVNSGTITSSGQLTLSGNSLAVFGPNSSWSRSLAIGGNANNSTSTRASIGVTNGNLHIDAALGAFGTYLNYYDGTAGVYIGNGAGGIVSHFNSSGHLNLAGTGVSQSGYVLSVGSTGVLDTSRNLANIGTLSSGAITTSGNFSMTGGYSMYLGTTSRFSSDNNGGFGINYGTTGGTAAASLTVYNNTSPTIELYRDGTVYVHKGQVWDVTTQGTGKGSIHIDPNSSTANAGGAITFGSSDHSNGTVADAGIYVRSDGSYGTRMYLSTTDSYAAGSKTAMTIDASGAVTINRNTLNIQSGLLIAGTSTIDAIRNATFANITNTNGAKIEIQGTVNGGSTRGIFMWDSSDTNWGIYMAEAGAGRSLSGGTAPASLDGRTSHHVRFRCYDTDAIRGWIFEGHSNTTKVSITSDTGDIHAIGFANTTNGYKVGGVSVVDSIRNGVFNSIRADGGTLIMGDEAYSASASYVGIKTSFMTGSNDYMMISGVSDPDTYVSAKNGASVNIRGGGNSSSNQLTVPDSSYMTATTSNFYVTGNVTAYYSSDESLKENIRVIDNPIDKIKQIRGVYFDWTDDYIKEQSGDGQIHIRKDDVGVIAQDVQPVLDEVVTTRADGTLAVKYEKMVALCIEAIKEQDEKIQKLEELVEKLISEK